MNKFQSALIPFANYYRRLTDGRRNYPKTGILHGFDEGCPTETAITVEDLKRASDLAPVYPHSWTPRVVAAYNTVKQLHAGEFRHDGVTPYIEHIDEVMARVGNNEDDLIVAACHDLAEHGLTTITQLEKLSFWNATNTDGVLTLTRRSGETYAAFARRIKNHSKGRWVKLKIADLFGQPRRFTNAQHDQALRQSSCFPHSMKHPLNPDFVPVFPPRYIEPAVGVPVIGKRRDRYLSLQVDMAFYAEPSLTIQVHTPTQRGAYTAALVYARRHHTQKRCTDLRIAFLDLDEHPTTLVQTETPAQLPEAKIQQDRQPAGVYLQQSQSAGSSTDSGVAAPLS